MISSGGTYFIGLGYNTLSLMGGSSVALRTVSIMLSLLTLYSDNLLRGIFISLWMVLFLF